MEEIIYKSGPAVVTKTLVRISGVSYPVNGIGSVKIEASNAPGALVIAVIAFVVAAANPDLRTVALIVAALFVIAALLAKAKLVIRTASGDQTALTSWRGKNLEPIMEAIERAVISRG